MPITSYEPQPTGVPASSASPAGVETPSEPIGAPTPTRGGPEAPVRPERVGIVFVHGIGTQTAGETFLDWSRPIVELLAEWQHSRTGETYDPVVRSGFSFHPAAPPLLELAIPKAGDRDESRWLITEAWWAADLRAPSFTEASEFLGRRLPRILEGIRGGYAILSERLRPRRLAQEALTAASSAGGANAVGTASMPGGGAGAVTARDRRWAWVDRLDELQTKTFGLVLLTVPLATLGLVVLGGYSLLRAIPFGPLRAFVELRLLDSFLVEWFGDLPILLGDATQAANIRARVTEAIDRVVREGAESVVLVAHSGGAIVSFEMLADPVYADRTVAKLITLGEGLKLARELAAELPHERLTAGTRVRGDLAHRVDLRWVDVWASYDPAPAGPFPDSATVRVVPPEQAEAAREAGVTVIEDRPVTNRMNVLRDHGAYWDNREGFLIPLVRHLDDPSGSGARSRFYPTASDRWQRIERRRQRVGVLAGWDWLVGLLTIAMATIALGSDVLASAGIASTPFAGRLGDAGDTIAELLGRIPGTTLLTGPIDGLASALAFLAAEGDRVLGRLATGPLTGVLAVLGSWGPGLVGLAALTLVGVVVATVGNARWTAWDRDEGREQLREAAPVPDRREPATIAVALLGVLTAFVLGTVTGGALLAVVALGLGLGVAAVLRLTWAATDRQADGPPGERA